MNKIHFTLSGMVFPYYYCKRHCVCIRYVSNERMLRVLGRRNCSHWYFVWIYVFPSQQLSLINKSHVQTFAIQCCKTTANASNLQLLAARSPLSCWMPWHLLWALVALPGTTSGGLLARLGSDVGCWGVCCQELALGLLLSTVKEHELSVVTTLMVITPPSMACVSGQTAVFYYPVEHVIVIINK